jgi:septum formation protein
MPAGGTAIPFLLASASPRRADLLEKAGASFRRLAVDVDETPTPGLAPAFAAEEIAIRKALAAARARPDETVLAADTMVVAGDTILGKPRDAADARRMLATLSGRAHVVVTAVAAARGALLLHARDEATVTFRPLSADEIAAYVATGEPLDKAGAYAMQGGAARFVSRLDGAEDTVVGLPVALALDLVARCDRLAASADGKAGTRPRLA